MSAQRRRTESELLAMLRDRYAGKAGNGEIWAFVPKVRDAAGFNAKRTIDALAMGLWPSRGLYLYGFEVKCDRGDWLRELKNPAKADAFGALVDFFYIVAADRSVVHDDELPEPWGLLVPRGGRLVQVVEPKALHDLTPGQRRGTASLPDGMSRSFLASLLRAACRTRTALAEELAAEYARGRDAGAQAQAQNLERLREKVAQLEDDERRFQEISGVRLHDFYGDQYRQNGEPDRLEQVAHAVKATLDGQNDVNRLINRLKTMRRNGAELVAAVDQALTTYEGAHT